MPEVDRTRLEMLKQEYERQMERIVQMKERVAEISGTAVSPRGELQVTVGRAGEVTKVDFLSSSYRRMTKNELSDLVLRTVNDARDKASDRAAELIQPLMPAGTDVKAMMTGKVDISAVIPDDTRLPEVLRERWSRQS
ncbi:YbaB/EbfC family nucleoid-associated protein [Amycolatopsis sp. NPDC059027]|uniref:YbaB/EbfC family nucleoid-associated protein n=1 Tax=unclassified Amycolatopsis TaxID=2618356 RepID=UPI0036716C53